MTLISMFWEFLCSGPTIDEGGDDEGDGGSPGDGPGPSHRRPRPPRVHRKQTPQQVAGETMISRLVGAADGTCYPFQ